MTKFLAKPKLNNKIDSKVFDTMKEAIQYLEDYTGHKMDYVKNSKTKERIYDWELIGKLQRIEA